MSHYDPEIDPSIRLEEEERVRLFEEQQRQRQQREELVRTINEVFDERERQASLQREQHDERATRRERFSSPRQNQPSETEQEQEPQPEPQPDKQTRRKSKGVETVKEVVSGGILNNPMLLKHYPHLIGGVLIVMLYLMTSFSVQRLYHTHQVLERKLRTVRTNAINMSSQAKSQSSRSSIVRRCQELGLDIEESTKPVKVIEK